MGILGIEILEEIERLDPSVRSTLIKILKKIDNYLEKTVKSEDFQRLTSIVSALAEEVKIIAEQQRKTEETVKALAEEVKALAEEVKKLAEEQRKLAERQTKTEETVKALAEEVKKLAEEVKELAERQTKTEETVKALTEEVKKLAEEQRKLAERQTKTEETVKALAEEVKKLAERQTKTEETVKALAEEVKKLAERQTRTEEELRKLIKEHEKTRKDLGGLTQSFGYFLENESYKHLPSLLERDYHLQITEPLDRKFIRYPHNRYDEVNIYGKGKIDGKEFVILGEVKSQLSKRHVDEFLKKVSRIKKFYNWETFLVLVTHMAVNPQVEDYVKDLGIALYKSSQFR
jgi:DNA repair exonuclease SbcCD ATPase subunit